MMISILFLEEVNSSEQYKFAKVTTLLRFTLVGWRHY
jgi:hypothetical protein